MERSLLCLLFQESEFYSKSNKIESVGSSLFSWLAFWLYFWWELLCEKTWNSQQMHFLLSWPRRGGRESQDLLRVVDVDSGPLHLYTTAVLDIWRVLFFFGGGCSFCQSSMSAWEVLSGDAENKSACHQGALRQVLRWGSVFPAPCSTLVCSRCGLHGLLWDLVLAPSTRSSLRSAGWGGSDPWDLPPFRCRSQVHSPVLLTPGDKLEISMTPSWGVINLVNSHSRETVIYVIF